MHSNKTNYKDGTTFQNVWDSAKAVLKGNFSAIQVHIKKKETYQRNNLISHLKELSRKRAITKNLKPSRRQEIIKNQSKTT